MNTFPVGFLSGVAMEVVRSDEQRLLFRELVDLKPLRNPGSAL